MELSHKVMWHLFWISFFGGIIYVNSAISPTDRKTGMFYAYIINSAYEQKCTFREFNGFLTGCFCPFFYLRSKFQNMDKNTFFFSNLFVSVRVCEMEKNAKYINEILFIAFAYTQILFKVNECVCVCNIL